MTATFDVIAAGVLAGDANFGDIAAEQAVLGAILIQGSRDGDPTVNEALLKAQAILTPAAFYKPVHGEIYQAMQRLADAGKPVDPLLLASVLLQDGALARIGGADYLHTLMRDTPNVAGVGHYAQIVKDLHVKRQVRNDLVHALQRLNSASGPDVLADIISDLTDLNKADESDLIDAPTGLEMVLDRIDARARGEVEVGLSTGIRDLDERLGEGLLPGQMVIVAARPGVGKSTLAMDIVRHNAIRAGKTVLFHSLEMGGAELFDRLLAAEARVNHASLVKGQLADADWQRITAAAGPIASATLLVDDRASVTIEQIRARAAHVKAQHGLDMVVIDYLQLLTPSGRFGTRQEAVADQSRKVKLLAKDLGVPVIVVCQVNRAATQRADGRPQVSDLRESGSLEQDADKIILIHREDYSDPESARAGEADLIIGKQRSAPTGVVTVAFQGHYSKFADMQKEFAVAA